MTGDSRGALRVVRVVLWLILVISLAGVAFSGSLTFREFQGAAPSCSAVGAPGTILGYPPCVYGLVMYSLLALLSGWGLVRTGSMPDVIG